MFQRKIEGPLGIWPFPILNFLVEVFQMRAGNTSSKAPLLVNEEEIIWYDWEGNERKTIIHRKVRSA